LLLYFKIIIIEILSNVANIKRYNKQSNKLSIL